MAFEVVGNPGPNIRRLQEQYLAALTKEIRQICLEVERVAKQNLTDAEKVDRGILRNSLDHEARQVRTGVEGITFAGAQHAPWVEFGRRGSQSTPTGVGPEGADAAFPPISVIRDWIKRNNVKLAVSGRTRTGKARRAKDSDLDRAAFLIARAIERNGIEPNPYLIPAFLEVSPFFRARLVKVLKQVELNLKGSR